MRKLVFCHLIFFLFIGCTATRLTSYKDPAYENKILSKILIHITENDLETRFNMEKEFVYLLSEHGIPAIESYKLFPPTRELTEEVMLDSITTNGIDTYLMAGILSSGVEIAKLPTKTISKTEGRLNVYDNNSSYESKTTTTEVGGGTIKKPWANIYTQILDAENGNIIWIADASSGGSAFTTFNGVYKSYCEKVIDKLFEDKLLISKTYDMIYLENGEVVFGEIVKQESNRILYKNKAERSFWIEDFESIHRK
jgi:hypothetical protein